MPWSAGTATQRVSTGETVYSLAVDSTGSYGLVFSADGRDYFAEIDAAGTKRGGDVDLGAASAFDEGGVLIEQYGEHLVSAMAPGRFVDVYVENGALGRREVVCAP